MGQKILKKTQNIKNDSRPRNFRNIKAWQFADQLVLEIYTKTRTFPKEELYGLVSQIRRAAVSIPTNIAEGASRSHIKEYLHFLFIARGSMAELEYLLNLSHRLNFLTKLDFLKLEA